MTLAIRLSSGLGQGGDRTIPEQRGRQPKLGRRLRQPENAHLEDSQLLAAKGAEDRACSWHASGEPQSHALRAKGEEG